MALVQTGWQMVMTVVDSAGDPTIKIYDLVAADAAAADTAGDAIRAAFVLVSGSKISKYVVGGVFEEDALVLPTDVENGVEAAVSSYIDAAGTKTATWKVPGALNSIFNGTTGKPRNVVNLANAGVIQYNSMFVAGAGQRATISDGEALKAGGMIAGVRVVGGKRQPTS